MVVINSKNDRRLSLAFRCSIFCVIALFFTSAVSAQDSRTRRINCDGNTNRTINKLINRSKPGDTVLIRGTCIENVNLDKGVTLDGGGTASIVPRDPALPTISISAHDATVKGLILDTVKEGIQIFISDRSLATIENNDIGNALAYGVAAFDMSSASIVGNRIYGNGTGVFAVEASNLRIGFKSLAFNEVLPNIIENNISGIAVARAFANISSNQIINNTSFGVIVIRTASVRVAANEISGNGSGGIFNGSNSTTDLALSEDGAGLFGSPNFGINGQFGLLCNSGFTSGIVGDSLTAVVGGSCESQLIFPSAPVPAPAP